MDAPTPERTELVLRHARRALWLLLGVFAALIAYLGALVFAPHSDAVVALERAAPYTGVAVALLAGLLVASRARLGLGPGDPNIRAVLGDDARREALDKAFRVALVLVLALQVPLCAWFWARPFPHAAPFAAALTLLLGMAILTAAFLYFDRG